ncbi:MAG: SDR family NAD(P)-dependent oxidoreductase [Alistipes sp.]
MDDKGLYIVTGATGGIGRALTEGLCRRGLRVVMACRNTEKAEAIRQRIMRSGKAGNGEVTVRALDMASLGSIGRFAERIRSEGAEIAALINNAGVMSGRFGLTADGIEQCMGVNYVGPYALTRLLLPMIADGGRIVNALSVTYRIGRIGPRPSSPSRNGTDASGATARRSWRCCCSRSSWPGERQDASASMRPTRAWSIRA